MHNSIIFRLWLTLFQNATGHTLSIPMPGHPIPSSPPSILEDTKKQVQKLEKLIEEHDVVYLLMDSRESRWLPTVIGRAKGKVRLEISTSIFYDVSIPAHPQRCLQQRRRRSCRHCAQQRPFSAAAQDCILRYPLADDTDPDAKRTLDNPRDTYNSHLGPFITLSVCP